MRSRSRPDAADRGSGPALPAGVRARKSLGQHFLHDSSYAQRIVRLVRPEADETVVEIGPGLGALTDRLAGLFPRLILIELDAALARRAQEKFAGQEQIRILEADALEVDWPSLLPEGGVVVGNLPYNVATPILHLLLQNRRCVRRVVAMIQKEVADRLVAPPGSRTYGALSILTQLDADVTVQFTVPPGAFVPRPKVDSAVVTLDTIADHRVELRDEERFRRLVRGVFLHRRKQLANALIGVVDEPRALLDRAGVDGRRRPETLSLAEYAMLERQMDDA